MRITQNSIIPKYETALQDIQNRQAQNQIRISTGKDIINISDDPKRLMDSKGLTETINRNNTYQNNIQNSLSEMQTVDDQLNSISGNVSDLMQLAVDSTHTGLSTNVYNLSGDLKSILEDLVKNASGNYNGKFMFAGTQTTPASITITPPATNNDPFELITEAPTAANPSGLRVIFKGNFNDRNIQTDKSSTEAINTKASDIFGNNGEDLFKPIIDLYNTLAYNSNGTIRQDSDTLTTADVNKIGNLNQSITDLYNNVTASSANNGSKINRLQAISDQITNQNLNLSSFRSTIEDTDVAKTAIELQKDNTALQYSLQVGSKLMSNTLFDFLTL